VKRLLVIGIGAGDPAFVTAEAAEALNQIDVFLMVDKGDTKAELVEVRQEVLRRFAPTRTYRIVDVDDPGRRTDLEYEAAVAQWHHDRVLRFEQHLATEVGDDECAGILVWGDPSLYDSTLRIIDQVLERGQVAFDHTVIPGISSIQVLAARHRIPLNRIGRSVLITTGRRLANGIPAGIDDVVVMLDGGTSFTGLVGHGLDIYWGAYLGSPDEMLIAGPLDEVAERIVEVRAEARRRKGWMFDTYLLRRRD
jgi:precorrin-6A synthase